MAIVITFPNGDALTLDAATSQRHGRTAQITEHEVEAGSDIADNIRNLPRELSIEGMVSRTPALPPGISPDPNRHIAAYTLLERARDTKMLVTVSTGLEVYPNMAIESLDYPRDANTGANLYFSISFHEVIFAVTQTAHVPRTALGVGSAAQIKKTRYQSARPVSRGLKPTTALSSGQVAKKAAVKAGIKIPYVTSSGQIIFHVQ